MAKPAAPPAASIANPADRYRRFLEERAGPGAKDKSRFAHLLDQGERAAEEKDWSGLQTSLATLSPFLGPIPKDRAAEFAIAEFVDRFHALQERYQTFEAGLLRHLIDASVERKGAPDSLIALTAAQRAGTTQLHALTVMSAKRAAIDEHLRQLQLTETRKKCGPLPSDSSEPVTEYLRQTANDPASVELVACDQFFEHPSYCYHRSCTFRERNKYGALVLRSADFFYDEGRVVRATEPQDIASRR